MARSAERGGGCRVVRPLDDAERLRIHWEEAEAMLEDVDAFLMELKEFHFAVFGVLGTGLRLEVAMS